MSNSRNAVLAALESGKADRGLAARRAMAAYAAEEDWSEDQLKKGQIAFTAIGKLVYDAGCQDSLASKMRGFAHPLVRSKFSAAEKAAKSLQKAHGGAVLSHLDKISMLMRRNKMSALAAQKFISSQIKEREDADKDRIEAFRKWVDKSATLPGRIEREQRLALLEKLDETLRSYKAPKVDGPIPIEPSEE